MKSLCIAVFSLALTATLTFAQPTPGPEHEILKKMEGTWVGKVEGGDDQSTGTMVCKMGLGGLWLTTEFKGEFGGMKFEGRGMETYDTSKKKYVSVWADSMGTSPMLSEGTFDKEKKTMTMTGESVGPDGKPAKVKMVTQHLAEDRQVFTMYTINSDGDEVKMMAIEYKRQK